ncbi:Dimeric dUTPase, all-alpha-NTP-PPase (MazG) superfamily [Oceanobacillus limi]|uniref:Dimeric dUTPase, all-alpha-NTP-PPase (MazG) superfamily n=1 Tax=Oceanobacillus limi TaxID=930131 RepID=A0A1I0EG60_9BACI|nr:dUTP diphosphatase [Oceanobacillus limi]SET44107.1 Dimeric dUTPase, all-alpha-NTP-PPase (MazG) superfamily [Oceanobacillus limi]
MDWSSLFSMQKKLDSYIEANHGLKEKNVFDDKYLALLVELGELANETRCFKFWSLKPSSSHDTILEEYVDGIHFILSLGIEKELQFDTTIDEAPSISLTQQFNKVFQLCVLFKTTPSKESYEQLFKSYLELGQLLGFSEKDIQNAYFRKNEINYERQNQGY